jgi:hypothetical protein
VTGDFRDGGLVPQIEAIKTLPADERWEALRKLWDIEPQFGDLVRLSHRHLRELDFPLPVPGWVKINDDNVVPWITRKVAVNKRPWPVEVG